MGRDITERVEGEHRREADRTYYKDLFELAPVPYLALAPDGRVLRANAAALALLGAAEGAVHGRPLADFLAPGQVLRFERMLGWLAERGSVRGQPLRLLPRDGPPRVLSLFALWALDPRGASSPVHCMLLDDTERQAMRDRLEQREARLARVLNTVPHGIAEIDRDGRILFSNAANQRMLGYAAGELDGRSVLELLPEVEEREALAAFLGRAAREQPSPEPYRNVNRRRDGRLIDVEVVWDYVRDPDGAVAGFITVVSDVTSRVARQRERDRLQRELAQAQKMEALGLLTGGIAHDFNNVLAAVLGFSELALMRAGELADPRMGDLLGEVRAAAERGKALIDQMLRFSRASDEVPKPLALAPQVQDTVRLLRATLPSSMEVRLDLNPELPPVRATPAQLQQVLLNLCVNARDAMDGAGTLGIGSALMQAHGEPCHACGARLEGEWVELWVSDTGAGIAPEVLQRLFEPFFTTKAAGHGTGLGLSVVRNTVQSLGGHLLVDTAAGRGTRFRVLLPDSEPLAEHPAALRTDREGTAEVPRGARILVVDDEPMLTLMLKETLAAAGSHCRTFCDPEQALAAFRRDPAALDLLITDQTMPKLLGTDLIREMRALRPDLPAILTSGYGLDAGGRDAALFPPGVVFLRKPAARADLVSAVRRLLGNRGR